MVGQCAEALDSSQGLCHVLEWIQEDLPLETKEGGTITRECQTMLDQISRPRPATLEHLQRAPTEQAARVQLPIPPPPSKENIVVFEDSHGFTKAVVANAPEGRVGTRKIIEKPWSQYAIEDVRNIIGSRGCSMLIFGATCDIPRSNSVEDIVEFQTEVMRLAFYIVKCIIVDELPVKKICFLTRGIFEEGKELHEQVGLSLTTFSALLGFCNTARLELEETTVQLIDTEYFLQPPFWQSTDFKLAQRLASEVWRNETFGRNNVRILNKGRYVARQLLAQRYAEAANVEFLMPGPGQIVGISGGNGSLGIVMAGWFVDQAEKQGKEGFTIQMLSRSCNISADNVWHYNKVKQKADRLNIAYEHKQCDLTRPGAAFEYVASTEGRLFGFIHAAGVLKDSIVRNLDWDKFEAVWNPKHRAAWSLHDAFERVPNCLAFFWMFSSSAVMGNMGQLNYSASNAAQDGLARHRRALGKAAQSMQWGAWGDVGMASLLDAASKRRMDMGPFPQFSNAQGLTGMEIGLRCNVPVFSVYKMNAGAMWQMTAPDETTTQSYMRSFTAEIVPPPPTDADPKHAYSIYRSFRFPQAFKPSSDMLVWGNFVAPAVQQEDANIYDETSPGCCTELLVHKTAALQMR